MARVIHTGDTHVGYRQYHAAARRQDFLDAFHRVIEDAIELDVDAVVHAGDLFHDRRPDLDDLLGTIDVLRTLRRADIPFLAVVGNHEGTHSAQWLDLFETLDLADHLDESGTIVDNTTFYGLDFVPRSQRGSLAYEFAVPSTDHAALVAHGRFTPFAHADWETETVLGSASIDFDAVLLGDIHQHGRERIRDVPVTYCGSTERTSAEDREPRGYNIVTFDDDVTITRRGIETRPFVFVDIELGPGEGTERVRERIREESVQDSVLIVTITGGGDAVTAADVELLGEELGALVTRVNDRRDHPDDGTAPTVEFTDPDAAVRERLRDLGLSEAARGVDDRVRDLELAKTNVRESVATIVRERLEDLEAFEPAREEPTPNEDEPDEANAVERTSEAEPERERESVAATKEGSGKSGQSTMGEFL